MTFGEVTAHTQCPYAPLATWREWRLDLPSDFDESLVAMRGHGSALRQRIAELDRAEIDMVALEIVDPALIGDLETFTEVVRAFMVGLHAEVSYEGYELSVSEAEWLLVIEGAYTFALAFAPFYEPEHPRYSPTGSAFIVVQFIYSFRKIGMHRMTVAAKRRLSDRVRATFEAAGVPYFAYITQDPREVLKLIKPLHYGDPPVRWWREPSRSGDDR